LPLWDLPEFFDADAELLRIAPFAELEALDQHFREAAAYALCDERVFAEDVDARRITVLVVTVFRDTHIARRDPSHGALLIVEHFCGRESGIDLDAEGLGLLREPPANIPEADDVAAMVAHQWRHEQVREAERSALAQEEKAIVRDRSIDRRALRLPVGDEV